jgi:hypothetical protein
LIPASRASRTFAIAALVVPATGFGVWALRHADPNAAGSPFLPCLFNAFTGLYCPGCGTTRALHALVHGDLVGMLAMNPLLPLVLVALPILVLQGLGYRLPLPTRLLAVLTNPKLWLVVIPGYWVLRNLPWWPFSWLAPG